MSMESVAFRHIYRPLSDLELLSLGNASGLRFDLLSNGAPCAIRHGACLVNQMIGVPPEGAPFRLWLRDSSGAASLVGPASADAFDMMDDRTAVWSGRWSHGLWHVQLRLDAHQSAWTWHVRVVNTSAETHDVDVVLAQDIGLAGEGMVRSNEAYCSHYIDHSVLRHPDWGPVIRSRQNLAQSGGKHPCLLVACTTGAVAYATDAMDVFGLEQRTAGTARCGSGASLPSVRRQGESACAALQSHRRAIGPKEDHVFTFALTFMSDHPDVTTDADIRHIVPPSAYAHIEPHRRPPASMWDDPVLWHGRELTPEEWDRYYPDRRLEEKEAGRLWSFFTEDGRHVVSGAKEAVVERMHGHVLCGSRSRLPEDRALGSTVYAPGIFNAQIFAGNPSLARLLTVVRDPLQRARACGQRIWIQAELGWRLLASPSAFEMGANHARWLYLTEGRILEITTRADAEPSAISVQARVLEGPPVRWRFTHQIALDANELDSRGIMEINAEQRRLSFTFDPQSAAGKCAGDIEFVMTVTPCDHTERVGGDEMIWLDGKSRGAPYAVVDTRAVSDVMLRVMVRGQDGLTMRRDRAEEMPAAWAMTGGGREAESLARIVPWFRHDAWIHLAAPHGLEQYGGAAWGVRDVCQGPVEWLITEQRYEDLRAIILDVFSHQYRESGMWPQWYMLGAYAHIQQKHCHGDIMLWPLKALCDYAEAANDTGILDEVVPYTDDRTFHFADASAPISAHVERVIESYRRLCIPGTSLLVYGDGDWDDTLQPAHPEMRDGMVSAWTVELAYQVFGQVAELYRRSGRERAAVDLESWCDRIREDFMKHMMPDGIVAGFAIFREGGAEPLLHPRDRISGISYRLLPMTRGIISGMFDASQAAAHCAIIREHLRLPDGVRLMDHPVAYSGGRSRLFQRAETAAYFGREVSLQYVHAHVRYAEAMAKLGDAEEAGWALQVVNPLGLRERVPHAAPRQSNVYFSSSDADVRDRYEAAALYPAICEGRIPVKSGWRLYSSGPGLFLHKVRCGVMGVREYYDRILFDPVIPEHLRASSLHMRHEGAEVTVEFPCGKTPGVVINGVNATTVPMPANPYRNGGVAVARNHYRTLLSRPSNTVRVG
ncbi:MAG: cellobiose phosphorylase [Kiritimatiellae bacterium]|nr:cellobiose phosphorylase [Kiritimatiellia bacterium]MCO5068667.1 cellobiose phosphorylase [Kiritimatiellia bacterium]